MKITSFHNKHLWTSFKESSTLKGIPVLNWDKLVKGDLTGLFKGEVNDKLFSVEDLENIRLSILDEHIQEFGLDEGLKERLKSIKKLAQLNCDYIETKDSSFLDFIDIETIKLEEVITKHFEFYEVLSAVTSYKKFDIDPTVYPAIKWCYDLKAMSNGKSS